MVEWIKTATGSFINSAHVAKFARSIDPNVWLLLNEDGRELGQTRTRPLAGTIIPDRWALPMKVVTFCITPRMWSVDAATCIGWRVDGTECIPIPNISVGLVDDWWFVMLVGEQWRVWYAKVMGESAFDTWEEVEKGFDVHLKALSDGLAYD